MYKCKDCGCIFTEDCSVWSNEVVDEELIPLCPDCASEKIFTPSEYDGRE